jgi:hypothetical protein
VCGPYLCRYSVGLSLSGCSCWVGWGDVFNSWYPVCDSGFERLTLGVYIIYYYTYTYIYYILPLLYNIIYTYTYLYYTHLLFWSSLPSIPLSLSYLLFLLLFFPIFPYNHLTSQSFFIYLIFSSPIQSVYIKRNPSI